MPRYRGIRIVIEKTQTNGIEIMKAGDYFNEIDQKHRELSAHIKKCRLSLDSENNSEDSISAINRNIKISIDQLPRLEEEMRGMLHFIDDNSEESCVVNYGWERYLPTYLKAGNGPNYDTFCELDYTAADQNDFEFGF